MSTMHNCYILLLNKKRLYWQTSQAARKIHEQCKKCLLVLDKNTVADFNLYKIISRRQIVVTIKTISSCCRKKDLIASHV